MLSLLNWQLYNGSLLPAILWPSFHHFKAFQSSSLHAYTERFPGFYISNDLTGFVNYWKVIFLRFVVPPYTCLSSLYGCSVTARQRLDMTFTAGLFKQKPPQFGLLHKSRQNINAGERLDLSKPLVHSGWWFKGSDHDQQMLKTASRANAENR